MVKKPVSLNSWRPHISSPISAPFPAFIPFKIPFSTVDYLAKRRLSTSKLLTFSFPITIILILLHNSKLTNFTTMAMAETPACPASEIIVSPGTDFVQREVRINFPATFTDEMSAQFVALQENMSLYYSWATNTVTDMVKRKLEEGKLEEGDRFAESGFRAKVMSQIFQRRSPWLISGISSDVGEVIRKKVSEFKVEPLLQQGRQLRPTPPEWAKLTEFINGYGQRVLAGVGTSGTPTMHYWLLITVFRYDDMVRQFKASLQMYEIMLKTTHEKAVVAQAPVSTQGLFRGGTPATEDIVQVDPLFSAIEYEFNNQVFGDNKTRIKEALESLVAKNS